MSVAYIVELDGVSWKAHVHWGTSNPAYANDLG